MSVHTYHPDSHLHGLADDCPRCAEHAEHPLESLDRVNLALLRDRIAKRLEPRSTLEARAMNNMQALEPWVSIKPEQIDAFADAFGREIGDLFKAFVDPWADKLPESQQALFVLDATRFLVEVVTRLDKAYKKKVETS